MSYEEALQIAHEQLISYRSVVAKPTGVVKVEKLEDDVYIASIDYDVIDGNCVVASYTRKMIVTSCELIK